ncbi:Fc.00g107040.m01.CDS01 [Cosmosporella sp. VM-42]
MASSSEAGPKPAFDNFYSPRNDEFYKQSPYKRLHHANHELRLIRLNSGSGDDPLECELADNLTLDSVRFKYIAISYYAGDPRDTKLISVNGIPFNAFATLANAIRHVRLSAESLDRMGVGGQKQMLWVDQICINQSDTTERTHQVGFMKDIYAGAGRSLVWLGGESSDGQALQFLRYQYGQIMEVVKSAMTENPDDSTEEEAIIEYTCEVLGKEIANQVESDDFVENWTALRQLLFSPWWSRCWVTQELIVSKAVALVMGPEAISWDNFRVAFVLVEKIVEAILQGVIARGVAPEGDELRHLRSLLEGIDFSHNKFMVQRHKEWEEGEERKLTPLLIHSRVCKSSDPRDRIYAFLGLADKDYNIVPGYDMANTIEDTLYHTARRVILHDRRLDILSQSLEKDRPEGSPSWVPDWRVPLERSCLLEADYNACGDYPAVVSFPTPAGGTDNRVIRTACLIIDQLASPDTMSPPHEDGLVGHTVTKWLPIAGIDLELPTWEEEKYRHTGQAMGEALLSILHLGKRWELEEEEDTEATTNSLQAQRQREILDRRNKGLLETVACGDWVFFRSPKGFMGVADSRSTYTDYIVIVLGASVPYILRKEERGYRLVGEVYVHGVMEGEVMKMMSKEELCIEMIDII